MSILSVRHLLREEAGGGEGGGSGGDDGGSGGGGAGDEGGAGGGGSESTWIDTLPEDVKGYVQNKGFTDPGALAQSYQNLEKLVGVPEDQLLKLPGADDEKAAEKMNEIFGKLGRPKEAKDYEIKRAEGVEADETYENWLRETALELNMTQAQVQGLVEKSDERVKAIQAEQATAAQTNAQDVERELRTRWGNSYDEKVNNVDRVAQALGFTEQQLKGLKDSMGPVDAMLFVDALGGKLGEDTFVGDGGGNRTGFGAKTPEAAQAEIKELSRDVEFAAKLQKGDVEAKRRWDRLHQDAYPD